MDNATIWKIIDSHFHENPQALVRHHIDSYNDFYKRGIHQIFKDKNPIRIGSKFDAELGDYRSQCILYLGGKSGDRLHFGKPVIYDEKDSHYMFPNEARLRNMTYGMTIHYDIEVEFIDVLEEGQTPTLIGPNDVDTKGGSVELHEIQYSEEEYAEGKPILNYKTESTDETPKSDPMDGGAPVRKKKAAAPPPLAMTPALATKLREATEQSVAAAANRITQRRTHIIEKIYLGKFPIMLQSDFCILSGLPRDTRHTMGECRNDLGGYFIIDGKEKTIIAQEKFADNMLYIRKVDDEHTLYSAEIRSVSENAQKPVRTFAVKMVAPAPSYTNGQIVVHIPNVRKPIPLFIVFRALGVLSDRDIIAHCLLDLDKYEDMIDLFIPSVHDASTIFTQRNALKYIASHIKNGGETTTHALMILSDYFLPHIGETNYKTKAYYLGYIVFRMLSIHTGLESPTDRDNFKYKRIELVGSLLYDLFREYYAIQQRHIQLEYERILYYNPTMYENNLYGLITKNCSDIFSERIVEAGFRRAYKGNWGAQTHTKRIGVVQDLARLSFNSAINHLRKTNLPLDSGVKLVGPRVLHNSQWGFIDPIDTPDGGSIGLHKHLAISTYVTPGTSREPLILWLKEKWGMRPTEEYKPDELATFTKVIVNGFWAGVVPNPHESVQTFRLYQRNALVPIYFSATFDTPSNTIFIYTDAGRLSRPVFYKDEETGKVSYAPKEIQKALKAGEFQWSDLITGFNKKRAAAQFDPAHLRIYELHELYEGVESETNPAKLERFLQKKAVIDYIDSSVSENAMIALDQEAIEATPSRFTHGEIHESLILGMMCNHIIFPENNPATRNSFSCGQSKQAVSLYHTNYQVRMDKTSVLLNYGQMPLVKSRYLDYIQKEEHPYGENAIVAIMCYTGYNVEDAMLINEAAIQRGLFRTSYFTVYEAHEESSKTADTVVDKRFTNVEQTASVVGTKPGFDYSHLDDYGLIREGTPVDDKTVLIGLTTNSVTRPDTRIDSSKMPKKGQLGVVDRTFITEGEEGHRIAKVRLLEQRIPSIGDKMASRAGQKGTIGMVVPERDMPFTKDGVRPDIIINPHAIPSRMTIGQLVECITGKACAMYGGFADCTAFQNKGSKVGVFGELLCRGAGFHSSGNEILYNGMTGEQIEMEIFMGPTYYMRLKHMVKDKINYRALGPRTALTKQPVSGRANDGGLRIGEMERDSVISHGLSNFLAESMMERGDKSFVAICNQTGMISIYNPAKNLFLSPMADGPIRFTGDLGSGDMRIEQVSQYGRSFSVISIPYSLKLLIQELQSINLQIRIITEDNIAQLDNLSYSHNIQRLTFSKDTTPQSLVSDIKSVLQRGNKPVMTPSGYFTPEGPKTPDFPPQENRGFVPTSPDFPPPSQENTGFVPTSPDFPPPSPGSPAYAEGSPAYAPDTPTERYYDSYDPRTPEEIPLFLQTPPDITSPLGGPTGTDAFESGMNVHYRGDFKPQRVWTVTNVGGEFITIRTDDRDGLDTEKEIQVVTPGEIFRVESVVYGGGGIRPSIPVSFEGSSSSSSSSSGSAFMPSHAQAPAPILNLTIAPKFMNGGNDNSTAAPPHDATAATATYDFAQTTPMSTAISNQVGGGFNIKPALSEAVNSQQQQQQQQQQKQKGVLEKAIDFSKGFFINKVG